LKGKGSVSEFIHNGLNFVIWANKGGTIKKELENADEQGP